MPFQPINLGNIIAQGEAIQGSRLNNLRIQQAIDPSSPENQLKQLQVEYQRLQNEALQNPSNPTNIGQVNPRDFTAESIAKFQQSRDFNDLVRHQSPKRPVRVDRGDTIEFYHPVTNDLLRSIPKGVPPDKTPDFKADVKTAETQAAKDVELEMNPLIAAEETAAKGGADRRQDFINKGVTAGDAYPTIARGLELLRGGTGTGGFDKMKLAASNFLGVTGADEGELSNNLGKAVLSQLRETFGAAFTAKEGEQLQAIEANFGKSTAANIRLLEQAEKLVKRAANRGIRAARAAGDEDTAREIEQALEFSLSTGDSGWKIEVIE